MEPAAAAEPPEQQPQQEQQAPQEGECIQVQFDEQGGLGLNFTPQLWPRIESIDPDSLAAATELGPGMVLVEVQGNDMVGKTLAGAGDAFAAAGRPLRLTFQVCEMGAW